MTLSVCTVTLQARDLLRDCLNSLLAGTETDLEVTVVDNGSDDAVGEMLAYEFPHVRFFQLCENRGYTAPMNVALRASQGEYLLQINPDTKVLPEALDRLVEFMNEHPHVGICGPKVLNRDGTLQKPCRRGESRPLAVIGYFTGLGRLFPRNRALNEYLMSYKDENEIHAVAGVAGSCMLIRRAVIDQIGYLDERFFAYQEDADFCFRARQAGWQVYYVPTAQIIHYGGEGGSQVQPFRSIYEWHRSYYQYYRKNLAKDYFFLFNGLFYAAMLVKLGLSLGANFLRPKKFAGKPKP